MAECALASFCTSGAALQCLTLVLTLYHMPVRTARCSHEEEGNISASTYASQFHNLLKFFIANYQHASAPQARELGGTTEIEACTSMFSWTFPRVGRKLISSTAIWKNLRPSKNIQSMLFLLFFFLKRKARGRLSSVFLEKKKLARF